MWDTIYENASVLLPYTTNTICGNTDIVFPYTDGIGGDVGVLGPPLTYNVNNKPISKYLLYCKESSDSRLIDLLSKYRSSIDLYIYYKLIVDVGLSYVIDDLIELTNPTDLFDKSCSYTKDAVELFIFLIKNSYHDHLIKFLDKQIDLNQKLPLTYKMGISLFDNVIGICDMYTLNVLIQYGADVTSNNFNPLFYVMRNPNIDVIEFMLNQDIPIGIINELAVSFLISPDIDFDLLPILINNGLDLNNIINGVADNFYFKTKCNIDFLERLKKYGFEFNTSIIVKIIHNNNYSLVNDLIKKDYYYPDNEMIIFLLKSFQGISILIENKIDTTGLNKLTPDNNLNNELETVNKITETGICPEILCALLLSKCIN